MLTLKQKEKDQLKLGLEYSFVDKNKHIKKNLAANLECIADTITNKLENDKKEEFHEFLRAYTDIVAKNIYHTKDDSYNNLKRIIKEDSMVVVSGDKDSCIVLMNKKDYVSKIQKMIDDGIRKGVYSATSDNTLQELKQFQNILYRNFKNYEHYDKMFPSSNQPGQIYGTAKTHKFNEIKNIDMDSLNLRPIFSQVGTCTYSTAQVISQYLKPLCESNAYIIRNTQDFPNILKKQAPLDDNEEYVSYDVESLFTNVPLQETIDYILHPIYSLGRLPKLCSKLIFKRLILKLTTGNSFVFKSNFY